MRKLIGLVIVAAVLWSGYWFVGSRALRGGLEAWFDTRRAEGWVAEYSDLSLRGFPNRFDSTFTDIALADPATGVAWQAPFFQIFALSYRPNHVIAVWPNDQTLATPLAKFDIHSTRMRASARVAPTNALAIEKAVLEGEDLAIRTRAQGGSLDIGALNLAVERAAGFASRYRFGVTGAGISPSAPMRRVIDPQGRLPQALGDLRADLSIEFDAPWDRYAIERARPQPVQIDVSLAEATWGELQLAAAGALSVDAAGIPTGRITLKARNWPQIITLARQTGALPEPVLNLTERALSTLAQMAGNPKTLDIPLDFKGGLIRLGPLPIGPAPVIRLR
ncbi:MAG: DUF2125 domain-containing protein [Paracoccaceae bacterium]